MSLDPASIAGWHLSFDRGAKVLLDMYVDDVGLQNLTVNLKCEVHPVTALSALAREAVDADASASGDPQAEPAASTSAALQEDVNDSELGGCAVVAPGRSWAASLWGFAIASLLFVRRRRVFRG